MPIQIVVPPPFSENERRQLNTLLQPLEEVEIDVRVFNSLVNHGRLKARPKADARLMIVGDLIQKTPKQLLAYKNFGKASLNRVKDLLESYGLELGMRVPEKFAPAIEEVSGALKFKRHRPQTSSAI